MNGGCDHLSLMGILLVVRDADYRLTSGEILCQQDDLRNCEDVIVPSSVDVLVQDFGCLGNRDFVGFESAVEVVGVGVGERRFAKPCD